MTEIINGLLISLGLSALVGLEREMHIQHGKKNGFGGLRTFAVLGPLGFLATFLEDKYLMPNIVISIFLVVFLFAIINYTYNAFKLKCSGLTTEISAISCFLIGILVAKEEIIIAIIVSILFSLLLALKTHLHKIAKNFKPEEFIAILKFLIITGVILPILPNETIDPWGIFNPKVVWLMVVLVAGIRFVGFFLAKILGNKKSIVLTGAVGGLVSSTAVTTSLSAQNKKSPKIVGPFLAGILFANAIMYVRVLIEAEIVYSELATKLAFPLFAMAFCAGIFGLFALIKKGKAKHKDKEIISQPFSLSEALKFGVFFMIILSAAKIIPEHLGDAGLYATSIISGLADTDAITLSVASLTKQGEIAFKTGASAITIAVMTNTIIKILIVFFFGGKKLKIASLITLSTVILVGGISLLFI